MLRKMRNPSVSFVKEGKHKEGLPKCNLARRKSNLTYLVYYEFNMGDVSHNT